VRKPVWYLGRAICIPTFLVVFRFRRLGREHLPREGPTLIVSNHISMKDPPFVSAAAMPRPSYLMAKSELFRFRPFGWLIESLGAFPVVRGGADREAIRTARRILADGGQLIMFPEGTRSRDGRLGAAFPGAGALALEPGVTVVPAAVSGSRRRLGPVTVRFGPPVDLSDLTAGPRGARAQAAAERVMAAIAALLPAADG
jgi:1-acyl-sn-glycerol-3-phosphate acyltransferase